MLAVARAMSKELAGNILNSSGYLFPFLSGMRTGEEGYKEYNAALPVSIGT